MKTKLIEKTEIRSVRYPQKMWVALASHAKKNRRTIAQEIIDRLQESLINK